ncbi:hypothetical protein [Cellulomonas wangsupingiae]|uniref:Uncharacterized protein n=1 Tax=Cellulomonas wangsupingiae TaxID=2968085 RepID=A0ABY5K7Z4_9CELL|nr:hypothetical protein [Cellulomonas wangsupingiae]UUI65200.1 hypothetical protein NP075_00175 [Cellulomonas wangsupingiae]
MPYDSDGHVEALVLDAVAAYDPDHVVLYAPTFAELEAVEPGSVQVGDGRGGLLEGDERAELLRANPNFVPGPTRQGHTARLLVAARCTPFRSPYRDDPDRADLQSRIGVESYAGLVTAERFLPTGPMRVLAPDPGWTSDGALWVSATHGLPPAQWSGSSARPEPPATELWKWALGSRSWLAPTPPPDLVIGGAAEDGEPEQAPTWFARLDSGVAEIVQGYAHDRIAVVLGDTASDFALAAIYSVLLRTAHWVPDEVLRDPSSEAHLAGALRSTQLDLEHVGEKLNLVSTSLSSDRVEEQFAALMRSAPVVVIDDEPRSHEGFTTGPPALESGLASRYLEEGVGSQLAIPVRVDAGGTSTTLTSFMPPTPTQSGLILNSVYWLVDVQTRPQSFPSGRGLAPGALLAPDNEWPPTIRASRFGSTLNPASQGFVAAGAVMSGRLARPILRFPGLRDWADAMAGREGHSVRHSASGQRAQFVASRLGSRQALTDLVNSPFLHALRQFDRRASQVRVKSKRHVDGVVDLDGDRAYLSAQAIGKAAGYAVVPEVRELLDRLCTAELARRGLILKCTSCRRASFHSVDSLSQLFRCPRCDASNALNAHAWLTKSAEPEWTYDLHSTLREVINQDGAVPFLAGEQLASRAQRRVSYDDCPELEILRDGKPVAEFDLLAHVDGEVIVVEAKSAGHLGTTAAMRKATARKLALAARLLRADAVCLATSATEWNQTDVERVRSALTEECSHAVALRTVELLAPPPPPIAASEEPT